MTCANCLHSIASSKRNEDAGKYWLVCANQNAEAYLAFCNDPCELFEYEPGADGDDQ